MSKTIKQHSGGKKHKEAGCHVTCCTGCATGFAMFFLLTLIVILVYFTYPVEHCPVCVSSSNLNNSRSGQLASVSQVGEKLATLPNNNINTFPTTSPLRLNEDQIWQQCDAIARKKNMCLQDCSETFPTYKPPGVGDGSTSGQQKPKLDNIRLNRTVLPIKYKIELQPWIYDADNARLDGQVGISMQCAASTDILVLHAYNLTVDQSSIELRENDENGRSIGISYFEVDTPRQYIKIKPSTPLQAGRFYYIKMKYVGTLLHKTMKGFYRASYIYQGKPNYIALTQFEEAEARKAFPCFDEPSFKAVFVVTLIRKPDYVALSNMEIEQTDIRNGGQWVADTFKETPKMSTYIVAMFVGKYVKKERTTPRGTLVRMWTQPNFIDYADFALSISGEIIEAFEDWTGIPYPLSKTDQLAVKEFAAGAMENWGLVIYSEPAILYNPAYSTTEGMKMVADVIAHELAHQWFGNLVTMAWWDDTFLNEGFATYMGFYVGVDTVRKNWGVDMLFTRQTQSVMIQDTRSTTQPIILDGIEQYDELHQVFSLITYNKGAAILRMIRYFLGETTFQKAIQNYLREHQNGNTVIADLIQAFNDQALRDSKVTWNQSKVNLTMITDSWLRQINYPLVEVVDQGNGRVMVTQSRFVDDSKAPIKYAPPTGEFIWHIPFTYADNKTLDRKGSSLRWVSDKESVFDTGMTSWKLVNIFSQGFYRVKYDPVTWEAILQQLKTDHMLIPIENRAELISDAFALANEGMLSEVDALSATEYLVNETEYLPWWPGLRSRLPEYEKLLRRTPTFGALNKYLLNLTIPNYEKLGWSNSDTSEHMEKYLRVLMVKEACKRKYQPCVLEALKQFQQYMSNMERSRMDPLSEVVNPIHPDLRGVVYCTAMAHGGPDVWEQLQGMFVSVFGSEDYLGNELNEILLGMICAEDPAVVEMNLEWAIKFNLSGILELVASKPNTISVLWDYLDRQWDYIPRGINKARLIWFMTDYFASSSDIKKAQAFIDNHPDFNSKQAKQLIEKVKANKAWVDRNQGPIRNWLLKRDKNPPQSRRRRSLLDALRTKPGVKSGNDRYRPMKEGIDFDETKFQFRVNNGTLLLDMDSSFNSASML